MDQQVKAPSPGTVACDCGGGRMRPAKLARYDFSSLVGFEVILTDMDGLRCDKCGAETLPGGTINVILNFLVVELAKQPRRLSGSEARYLRHNLDVTQEELASRMGIVRETVAKWECGDAIISPQHDFILRLFSLGEMAAQKLIPPQLVNEILSANFKAVRLDPPGEMATFSMGDIRGDMATDEPAPRRRASAG